VAYDSPTGGIAEALPHALDGLMFGNQLSSIRESAQANENLNGNNDQTTEHTYWVRTTLTPEPVQQIRKCKRKDTHRRDLQQEFR